MSGTILSFPLSLMGTDREIRCAELKARIPGFCSHFEVTPKL